MAAEAEAWRVLGASVRGSSHIKREMECQDAHIIRALGPSQFVVVVADGAGSARRSAEGAAMASAAAADYLAERLSGGPPGTFEECEEMLRGSLLSAQAKLASFAADGTLEEFATTLLVCFLDANWLGVGTVGDGAIVFRTGENNLVLVQPERSGEYLNETDFVTSPHALERALIHVRPADSVSAIAIFTDGVEWAAIKYKEHLPHAPFFHPLFQHAANPEAAASDIEEFLGSARFCEQTDDDKTLVLAVRG